MNACAPSSCAAALGPTATNASPSSRTRSSSPAGPTRRAAAAGPRVDVERAEQLADQPGEVLAQPRHAAELERVRGLVQRDPAQQLVGVGLERVGRVAEVGRHEQQPRGRGRVEQRELVLAEHAAGEEARDRARLERQQRAGGAAQRAEPRAELVGHGVEHAAQRAQVGLDPLVAVDGLGDGSGAARPRPV